MSNEGESPPHKGALPVFPDIPLSQIRRRQIRNIDDRHFVDDGEVELLLQLLFDGPEITNYVFHEDGKPLNGRLLAAVHTGALLIEESQNYWYRHPRSAGDDFIRIAREPPEFEWEAEVVTRGPRYWRCTVRLTEAERRRREVAQQTAALTAALKPPEPTRQWAKLKRHWDRNQLVYGGIGLFLAILGLIIGIVPLLG